jgi:hypothetical protein
VHGRAGRRRSQLVQRSADEHGQGPSVVLAHPPLEGDAEDDDPGFGGQAGGRLLHAPVPQGGGHGRGQGGQFDQLPLLELRVGTDDGLAQPDALAVLLEPGGGRLQ